MTNQTIARDLLAILCCLQGLTTLAIDLNRTHATNPEWPGHAPRGRCVPGHRFILLILFA